MSWNNTHPAFKQAIGVHEGLRRLGFASDDIFVTLDSVQMMNVVLRTQGKDFIVSVGTVDMSYETWHKEWCNVVDGVISGAVPDDQLQHWFNTSISCTRGHEFIMALTGKGIRIPKSSAKLN